MKFLKKRIFLHIFIFFIFLPAITIAGITEYKPQVDVSFGTFNYFFNKSDLIELSNFKKPEMGFYLGGYISMTSPFMRLFSSSSKFISIYEFGVASNLVENSRSILITVPISWAVGYPMGITKKLKLIPFLGSGFSATYLKFGNFFSPVHFYLIGGLEIRRKILKKSYFRIKCDAGLIYSGELKNSVFYFIRTRFPVPFLP